MKRTICDGSEAEPVCFMPILPLILLNGGECLTAGHKSYIPPYNMMSIAIIINDLLNDVEEQDVREKCDKLLPYWRDF